MKEFILLSTSTIQNCSYSNSSNGQYIEFYFLQVAAAHLRYLSLFEYQSKALLQSNGIAIQQFRVVENLEEVKCLIQNFSEYDRL
jgi:hypothetical protein